MTTVFVESVCLWCGDWNLREPAEGSLFAECGSQSSYHCGGRIFYFPEATFKGRTKRAILTALLREGDRNQQDHSWCVFKKRGDVRLGGVVKRWVFARLPLPSGDCSLVDLILEPTG